MLYMQINNTSAQKYWFSNKLLNCKDQLVDLIVYTSCPQKKWLCQHHEVKIDNLRELEQWIKLFAEMSKPAERKNNHVLTVLKQKVATVHPAPTNQHQQLTAAGLMTAAVATTPDCWLHLQSLTLQQYPQQSV